MDISTKNSGYESLFDRCSSLCSELVKQGCKFSFSLKLEESFSFTLSSEKAVPRGTRKRPPSYQRRQLRRKTELLQRRTEFRRTNEAAEDIDNDGRRQEGADLLDKKMVSSRQTATEENNSSLDLGPYLVRGLVGDSNESEKESDDSESEEGSSGSQDDPEGDQWTPVTHKMRSPKRPSTPTMQKYIIRTHNPFYRTANVAVFAPDDTVYADIANAVEGGNMQKLKQIPRLFETYEYSCDGNWLGYTPAESTVLDRQLYLKP